MSCPALFDQAWPGALLVALLGLSAALRLPCAPWAQVMGISGGIRPRRGATAAERACLLLAALPLGLTAFLFRRGWPQPMGRRDRPEAHRRRRRREVRSSLTDLLIDGSPALPRQLRRGTPPRGPAPTGAAKRCCGITTVPSGKRGQAAAALGTGEATRCSLARVRPCATKSPYWSPRPGNASCSMLDMPLARPGRRLRRDQAPLAAWVARVENCAPTAPRRCSTTAWRASRRRGDGRRWSCRPGWQSARAQALARSWRSSCP